MSAIRSQRRDDLAPAKAVVHGIALVIVFWSIVLAVVIWAL